jgi:hypothetical protein
MFERHQHRAAPFGAECETLNDADRHEQSRCKDTDLCVGGQAADQDSGDAHDEQCTDEDGLAAEPIREISTNAAADRTHQEADTEGGERQKRAGDGV